MQRHLVRDKPQLQSEANRLTGTRTRPRVGRPHDQNQHDEDGHTDGNGPQRRETTAPPHRSNGTAVSHIRRGRGRRTREQLGHRRPAWQTSGVRRRSHAEPLPTCQALAGTFPLSGPDKLDQPTISRISCAVSDGVLPTRTPTASSASCFAAAVPLEPETIAPAWPIVLPSGAVNPATYPTTGFVTLALMNSAARSSASPPISPIITIASVSGSSWNARRQSMWVVPTTGSPPMPTHDENPTSGSSYII